MSENTQPIPEWFKEWAKTEAYKSTGSINYGLYEKAPKLYQDAAEAVYRHLSSQPSPGLRWVKASERLPKNDHQKEIVVKLHGSMLIYKFFGGKFHSFHSIYMAWKQSANEPNVLSKLMWLEETPAINNPTCSYPDCYPEGGAVAGKDFLCEDQGPPECTKQCWSCEQTVKMGKVIPPFPPEGGGEGEEDRFCPKCGESWEAHSTICRRKPETRAIDVDADEAKGEIEFLDRDNDRLRAALRDIAGGTALPQLIAQQALGPAPEAQPINGDVTDYTVIHGNCQLHGPYVGQCLICNTGVITTSTTNAQPIAASEEVPEDIAIAELGNRQRNPQEDKEAQIAPEDVGYKPLNWEDDKSPVVPDRIKRRAENLSRRWHALGGRPMTWEMGVEWMYAVSLLDNSDQQKDLFAARNKNNDDGIQIARLLAEKKKWETRCLDAENNLTAMIDEALQKSKRLDEAEKEAGDYRSLLKLVVQGWFIVSGDLQKQASKLLKKYPSPTPTNNLLANRDKDIKRQTIDRLYNEILAAGVEFPPAAREVFHRAMNELAPSPTQNSDK